MMIPKTINLNGHLLSLEKPKIMGIINLTPDSFYSDSRYLETDSLFFRVEQMLKEGADLIDLGAVSSRPGSEFVSEEEEKSRLLPALESLTNKFPDSYFSIDTFRASIAEESVKAGASMINDISGGLIDENMPETIAKIQVPYVLMHMRGTPQNMTELTTYSSFPQDVYKELAENLSKFRNKGVNDIIIDPGFGFAKNIEQNFDLFKSLHPSKFFGCPLLIGISRKGMIHKTLKITPEESLNGTTALHMAALIKGADILRVHDVIEAKQTVDLFLKIMG